MGNSIATAMARAIANAMATAIATRMRGADGHPYSPPLHYLLPTYVGRQSHLGLWFRALITNSKIVGYLTREAETLGFGAEA